MISYNHFQHHHHQLLPYVVLFITAATYVCSTAAAILPGNVAYIDDSELYSSIPNEILPIQPLLIYPKSRNALPYQSRNLLKDNDIIYVKLLDRKSYRPRKKQQQQQLEGGSRELQMKDIFYVKAVANGQFSTNRLKVYRLPEFYAINVYKKSELNE